MFNIDKFKRFSMCNCLTVRMDRYNKVVDNTIDRTYTAHLMTPDLFLKRAKCGAVINLPFKDFWPSKKYVRQYFIPKKINTFLISTFNEIYHPNYSFGNSIRYVVPKKFRKIIMEHEKATKKNVLPIGKITAEKFAEQLIAIDKKINRMWGKINKILVFYDHKHAPKDIQKRANKFNKLACAAVGWPVIQINEVFVKKNDSWQHYSMKTYLNLLKQIEKLEK